MIRNEHIKVNGILHPEETLQHTYCNTAACVVTCLVFREQYSVPVIKYDRNGFKPRPRQLVLTQTAAYVIEEAKIKQRVLYTSLKGRTTQDFTVFLYASTICNFPIAGISVSNLNDGMIVFHVTCEDPKQKVTEQIES